MRKITKIIMHCSATAAGKDFSAADIDRWHRARGFRSIGYHYVVRLDGSVERGRPEAETGAHCLGQNSDSIGVCYIGGLAADGKTPADTRTPAQKRALRELIASLKRRYPSATVHGHREFAAKACPCFDAAREYAGRLLMAALLLCTALCSCRTGREIHTAQEQTESTVAVESRELRVSTDSLQRMRAGSVDSVIILRSAPCDTARPTPATVSVKLYGVKSQSGEQRMRTEATTDTEAIKTKENRKSEATGQKENPTPSLWILFAATFLTGYIARALRRT